MDALIRFGFSIEEIKDMMDTNTSIENTSDKVINELINILMNNNCDRSKIKNIILCNPFYLSRNITDINNLIYKLKYLDIKEIDMLLDSNPYILNLDVNDLNNIVKKQTELKKSNDEIIDYIRYNIFY
jgi:hypothetical protein